MPRSYFGKRDGNIASKDIAESPTAIAGTPKEMTNDKRLMTKVLGVKLLVQHPKFCSKKSVVRCPLSLVFYYLCQN